MFFWRRPVHGARAAEGAARPSRQPVRALQSAHQGLHHRARPPSSDGRIISAYAHPVTVRFPHLHASSGQGISEANRMLRAGETVWRVTLQSPPDAEPQLQSSFTRYILNLIRAVYFFLFNDLNYLGFNYSISSRISIKVKLATWEIVLGKIWLIPSRKIIRFTEKKKSIIP